jgi:drug/metabolite transporter (DMT)-like permease
MLTYLKLFGTAFFWGGTFVAGRWLARDVDPYAAAFFRFFLASLCLLALTRRTEGSLPKLNRRHLVVVAALGFTGVFSYNIFFFKGLALVSAGRAALIIALNPVCITLLAAIFYRERLPLFRVFGILLSVTGAVWVISGGHLGHIVAQGVGRGELLILGCVLSWGLYSVIGKSALRGLSPLVSVTYSAIAGTLFLLPLALLHGAFTGAMRFSWQDWLSIGYLGVFGTVVGFLWYFQGIERIGPTRAGVFINFVPVNGLLLGALILGEQLTLSLVGGGALVVLGSFLANTARFGNAPPRGGGRCKGEVSAR